MVVKIKSLKNFGIFYNFSWGTLSNFKKYNLIYGWNRSGKTTISRVFSACELKSKVFDQYPKGGDFEIIMEDGSGTSSTNVEACTLPIKVFNQDFIDNNISFKPSASSNPILIIGAQAKEDQDNLNEEKKKVSELEKDLVSASQDLANKEKIKITFLKSLGIVIADAKFDKTYNRSNVEAKIKEVGVDNFENNKISSQDEKKYKSVSNSDPSKKQGNLSQYRSTFIFGGQNITSFRNISLTLNQLLDKKIVAQTIQRLQSDGDVNHWVQEGVGLHELKKEKDRCLFCTKPFDKGYLDALSQHFSTDYKNFQQDLKDFILQLANLKQKPILNNNPELYPDLHEDYKKYSDNLNAVIQENNLWVDEAQQKLNAKLLEPLTVVAPPKSPEDFKQLYDGEIGRVNSVIQSHNKKIDNHDKEVGVVRDKLEQHLIAVALEKEDYKKMETEEIDAKAKKLTAKQNLRVNQEKIKELEEKNSTIGQAIDTINQHLESFFGRGEIKLELDKAKKGYVIKRDEELASNLSEGEKTAIAFSYFVVKVGEKNFDPKSGIIYIDDPISSFDSHFVYHVFSVIKNNFSEVKQLFISTHNFELFNLVKSWLLAKKKRDDLCGFYMVENTIEDNKRCAHLGEMESTLLKFKSEYHFLFSRLKRFTENGSPDYSDYYTIGNIARRFLEIFTNFKIPRSGDLYSKINDLDKGSIDQTSVDKVYKLINEFSHDSDPISIIEHKDKSESQEAVKILLNIIKESDPKHYKLLDDNS